MPVIEVANLHKRYGERVAVEEVSFHVERGEIFGILGRNGAGKTTTVECLTGLRTPDGGRLRVLGLDPARDGAKLRERVGVQLQEAALPDKLRVGEAVELYASFYPAPADPAALLDTLGLTAHRRTPFKKLSGGQKQRLSIALALIGNPEVAVLDELTTGLDPQARRDTWRLIEQVRDRGVTILLVTHFMAEAERLCDRLAVIEAGRVLAVDSPAGLVSTVDSEQRLTFRLDGTLPEQALRALPEVSALTTRHDGITVSGKGNLLNAVVTTLSAHQLSPLDLSIERSTLDDAFLALTGAALTDEQNGTGR
ncbi:MULTISPECIES: ABC transporter ATP-binding protein [unclassified Crossiella]|uniref:ABC transporter ATP-binding protein n=1 Tax=unclassified Crossiella TaxID=2620835 RepID=UPI001FFEA345|nr:MULTISPECIES: ABC transporter ATP-binding protein [unclassified Crossiella]MCK2243214.1 ABC transporter ATP-binding protein [Crossiella sp. S99.2]MCK2254317.1 ABC transporter ATP-binding protein [Crossiella sp. S99.1]